MWCLKLYTELHIFLVWNQGLLLIVQYLSAMIYLFYRDLSSLFLWREERDFGHYLLIRGHFIHSGNKQTFQLVDSYLPTIQCSRTWLYNQIWDWPFCGGKYYFCEKWNVNERVEIFCSNTHYTSFHLSFNNCSWLEWFSSVYQFP